MIKIQNLVLEHKRRGVSQVYVYRELVEPVYNISFSTFNRYLGYPAKRELKKLEERMFSHDNKQMSLFD